MNILLDEKRLIKPIFARHETFHPRFGWIKKGYDKSVNNPNVFTKENSQVVLGVGKNMVSAIKYWCYAYKVIEENETKKGFYPTEFGKMLLDDNGYDPYFEDLASLWLLHWNLLNHPCMATTWYYVFNEFFAIDFSIEELLKGLKDFNDKNFSTKISDSSLLKDLHCLIRMYLEPKINKTSIEDSIDSPFVDLKLIQTNDHKSFSFNIGEKPGLSPEIIVYACLDFLSRSNTNETIERNSNSISISRLLHEKNSPGLIFKLSENVLYSSIENILDNFKEINLSDTAGVIQFSVKGDPFILSKKVLDFYYSGRK